MGSVSPRGSPPHASAPASFGIRIEPVTPRIARAAARLRSRRRTLRLPDAFVLAAGDEIEADVILAGDDSWAELSKRVAVVGER